MQPVGPFLVCRIEPRHWPTRQQVARPLDYQPMHATRAEADAALKKLAADEIGDEAFFDHDVFEVHTSPRRFLVRWNPAQIEAFARPGPLRTDDWRYSELQVGEGDFVYLLGRHQPGGQLGLLSRMTVIRAPSSAHGSYELDIPFVKHNHTIQDEDIYLRLLFWRATPPNFESSVFTWDEEKQREEVRRRLRKGFNRRGPWREDLPSHYRCLRPALVEPAGPAGAKIVVGQTLRLLSEIAWGAHWLDHLLGLGPRPRPDFLLDVPSLSRNRGRAVDTSEGTEA